MPGNLTVTGKTMRHLTSTAAGVGQRLLKDNFSASPVLSG